MGNNEYTSSETRTHFLTELLSLFRIFFALCIIVAPGPTLICMIIYIVGRGVLGKQKAKRYILILAGALLALAIVLNFRTILPDLTSNYISLIGFVQAAFQHFMNTVNDTLGMATTQTGFHISQLLRWAMGENLTSFALYFFLTALLLRFYRTSDEVIYQEAKRKREAKHNAGNGRIDISEKGHVFCIGTTGSGKTANIMHYIKDAFKNGTFLAVIDGKGDMKQYSLYDYVTRLCVKHQRRLYIINQSKIGESTPYNPFKNATATQIKDMLLSMSEWSEEYYKTQAERYWQCMANVLLHTNTPISFKTLIHYSDRSNLATLVSEYRERLPADVANLAAQIIRGKEGENALTAAARFSVIAEGDGEQMFSDDGFNIEHAYRNNGVVLVLLNDFAYSEFAKSMGHLVIEDMKNLISRINSKAVPEKDVLYIFDEVSVYINPQVIGILNRGRSANVRAVVGTQSIADIDFISEPLRRQVLENSNNFIIMRVNESTGAEEMANIVGTNLTVEQTRRTSGGDYTGESSNKVVDEYRINPNDIKNLANLEGFFYSKNKPQEVVKFITEFVEV